MSKDFQLAWSCPHLTVEERVSLGGDRRTLSTRQPVAATGRVRILVNDEMYIPQGGLYVPAQLFGAVSGPFDLVENQDTLIVESSAGAQTFAFGIRGTQRKTAKQVLTELARQGISDVLVEDVNGHLVFTDTMKVGSDSFVRVSGSAAVSLGFGAPEGVGNCGGVDYQWRASGKRLYPGWGLEVRPDTITNRYPRFLEPIRNNPYFKVTYTVPPTRCLRCQATYVENDYRYNTSGQAVFVENENLLYQAALKMLLTDRGSNPYHPWYGTQIRSRVGSKALSGIAAIISEDVRKGLSEFQKLQEAQSKYQSVTFKERLYSILNVEVLPHQQDPTTFMIGVTVQNASGQPINLTIVFTVPDVVALMGSNGLMLGTERSGITALGQKTIATPPYQLNPSGR